MGFGIGKWVNDAKKLFVPSNNPVDDFTGELDEGSYSFLTKAIKTAGATVIKPLFAFIGGLIAVVMAAQFDLLKIVFLWIIDLLSKLFTQIVSTLGFKGLEDKYNPAQMWNQIFDTTWGKPLIQAMWDLGIIEAIVIILIAIVIKFILMIIPFVG